MNTDADSPRPDLPGHPGHMGEPDPRPGTIELLVLGQCECGWRCACPEGAKWPSCPNCGRLVMPPPAPLEQPPGGGDHGDRLGYVAELMGEGEAVAMIAEVRGHRKERRDRGDAPVPNEIYGFAIGREGGGWRARCWSGDGHMGMGVAAQTEESALVRAYRQCCWAREKARGS